MPKISVTVTFGDVLKNAGTTTAYTNMKNLLRDVQSVLTDDHHGVSLMSVTIRPGDYECRLFSGEWVAAPEQGWGEG